MDTIQKALLFYLLKAESLRLTLCLCVCVCVCFARVSLWLISANEIRGCRGGHWPPAGAFHQPSPVQRQATHWHGSTHTCLTLNALKHRGWWVICSHKNRIYKTRHWVSIHAKMMRCSFLKTLNSAVTSMKMINFCQNRTEGNTLTRHLPEENLQNLCGFCLKKTGLIFFQIFLNLCRMILKYLQRTTELRRLWVSRENREIFAHI